MRSLVKLLALALFLLWAPASTEAEGMLVEDFSVQPETRWQFIADTVMGGVSRGEVAFEDEGGNAYARMTGKVSTENNGGFIQIRLTLAGPPSEGSTGLRLIVRGNNQRYFVHLRTGGTVLPWQYYQAGFDVAQEWSEIRLPLTAFKASGWFLRDIPLADSLESVAIVAFGRDHKVEIDVREIGFY